MSGPLKRESIVPSLTDQEKHRARERDSEREREKKHVMSRCVEVHGEYAGGGPSALENTRAALRLAHTLGIEMPEPICVPLLLPDAPLLMCSPLDSWADLTHKGAAHDSCCQSIMVMKYLANKARHLKPLRL